MPRHEPTIGADMSACSCRKWNGPLRRPNELVGAFTHRAAEAHRAHIERARQTESQEQVKLFDHQEELFA